MIKATSRIAAVAELDKMLGTIRRPSWVEEFALKRPALVLMQFDPVRRHLIQDGNSGNIAGVRYTHWTSGAPQGGGAVVQSVPVFGLFGEWNFLTIS